MSYLSWSRSAYSYITLQRLCIGVSTFKKRGHYEKRDLPGGGNLLPASVASRLMHQMPWVRLANPQSQNLTEHDFVPASHFLESELIVENRDGQEYFEHSR